MMVQDQFSGNVHEVPDAPASYGVGGVLYDGLGNPVGWNPFSALRRVVSAPLNLVRSAVQGVSSLTNPQAGGAVFPQPPYQPASPYQPSPYQTPPGYPPPSPYGPPAYGAPRPPPLGWINPPLPYTGLGPRRLYMRCAVWPGPQGLVPGYAANMPPGAQPGVPGLPGMPGMPGMPGYPGGPGIFGGGRRRRRR